MREPFLVARPDTGLARSRGGEHFGARNLVAVMNDAAATILVVEDDDATRTFLADNLSADGYEPLTADCARDARRLLETKFPDLAIVDLGLPDGSGLELVRRVREADGVASRIDPERRSSS